MHVFLAFGITREILMGFQILFALIIALFSFMIEPATSLEIQSIVFTSLRDGNAEIYLVDSDGANLQNLTNNPAEDMHPTWSPDGTKIVFVSNRDAQWGLYEMEADGGNVHLLISSEYVIDEPLFSPDGTLISYVTFEDESSYSGKSHVMLISANGQNLIHLADDIKHLAWTPDGQYLFGRWLWNTILYSINVSDGEQSPFEGMYAGSFSISPDGTQLAYDYGGEFSAITLRNLDSGDEVQLPGMCQSCEASDFGAQWSPDGMMIAYITQRGYGILDIYVTEPNPVTTPRLLYDEENFHSLDPVWSDDSTRIAFLGAFSEALDQNYLDKEAFDIFVIDVNGDNLINLSNHPARDAEPRWRPRV
jgi:Tol biopolymer transport system component